MLAYQIFSIALCLFGLGGAAAVLLSGGVAVFRQKRRLPLLYMAVAGLYGAAMVRNLFLSLSPYSCSRIPASSAVLAVLLLLLQLFFLFDLMRGMGTKTHLPQDDRTDN